MLKCINCKHNKKCSSGTMTPGGQKQYIITCKKEFICFEISFDAHKLDLPCYTNDPAWKKLNL